MKKRTIVLMMVAVLVVCFIGCATNPAVETAKKETSLQAPARIADDNNVSQDAYQTVIVDWARRTLGESRNPEWLKKMIHGNGLDYCVAYGLEAAKTRKFILPSAAYNVNLNNALNEAQVEVAYTLAQEMAMSINATMGNSLTDGQKEQVRAVCVSVKADITGLRREGDYWQLEKTTDDRGNVTKQYLAYQFYSMSLNTYNELLNVYMIELLQSKGIDRIAANTIAGKAQEILDDAQERSDRVEKQRAREHEEMAKKLELEKAKSDNETKKVEAAERTKQVQSKNEAVASIANSSANASVASSSTISPALAAVLTNFR